MKRRGFTMVELLCVIVTIGIIAGLLVPALVRAVRVAREAATAAEINGIEQALAQYQTTYGDYPPSRIVLSETGDYSAKTLGPDLAPLVPRTIAAFRKFCPRVILSTSGPVGAFYDFNGNGKFDPPCELSGAECLTFFLGGVPTFTTTKKEGSYWTMTGWSKSVTNPWQTSVDRVRPLMDFPNSRLVVGPNGFPALIDLLGDSKNPKWYAYFRSYNGQYDPDDCNFVEEDSTGQYTTVMGAFAVNGNLVASAAPNPYLNDIPVSTDSTGHAVSGAKYKIWERSNTYQIISAGVDRHYGIGGQYLPRSDDTPLPFVSADSGYVANSYMTTQATADVTKQTLSTDERTCELDNVTSFSQGRLD